MVESKALADAGPLILVGAGKMGTAMLEGWLKRGLPGKNSYVLDPHISEDITRLAEEYGVNLNKPIRHIAEHAIAVLAVKPQLMSDVLVSMQSDLPSDLTFMSVAAGWTIANFETILGDKASIIRVMPNTPSAVSRGMSVLCANQHVCEKTRVLCGELMKAVGRVEWIEDEALMDAVTGVSGSGPAYIFHLVEALAKAGRNAGLSEELANILARQTVTGAGELLHQSELPASKLRENVTSPNGTTAAALQVLMDQEYGLTQLVTKAVLAATNRSKELSN